MLVGDTRPFRAVDDQGHALHEVQWTISEPRLAELSSGDDVEITAKAAGSFTLTAHASAGFADARIEVVQASALPEGTIKWKVADRPGCHTIRITPAVPSAGGPDIFEESGCADGTYVQALTADGVLLWRRKMDSEPHSPAGSTGSNQASPVASLNPRARSICDAISVGMPKGQVAELVKAHKLATPDSSGSVWLVEEPGSQCKLWFDAGFEVTKKRKILVTE
jgi:hypothetical protein